MEYVLFYFLFSDTLNVSKNMHKNIVEMPSVMMRLIGMQRADISTRLK